ncbi:SDR family NAD(P)-dependent oxidoreductase [Patulibacter sp. NPDC049589]|uniref:SDR family NAD(P)-dependent oxidoreductase n=1 Tax=Patulibacter sp. NPDC049589 TaxID=3154731 RepID=UPI00341ABC77
MTKTIAIFGAGPGLGTSVARRFGREGYRVALVGRRPEPLEALVVTLAAEGVEAAAFPADLRDLGSIPALVAAITDRFGSIDVVEYAPVAEGGFVPAAELTAEALRPLLDIYLLAPVEVVRAVLPQMLERGDGAILLGHGASAVLPPPGMSGPGQAMGAARNWIHGLHAELAPRGVYAGTIAIAAMIERSAAHDALRSGAITIDLPDGVELPTVDPDGLADTLWAMAATRDRVETVLPEGAGF